MLHKELWYLSTHAFKKQIPTNIWQNELAKKFNSDIIYIVLRKDLQQKISTLSIMKWLGGHALDLKPRWQMLLKTSNTAVFETITLINTSATNSFSSFLKKHLVLKASIRSWNLPYFGTVTVNGAGIVLPSVLKTVTVIVLIVVEGIGSDRYISGSNVTDTLLQTGQTNIERYWPYNKRRTNVKHQGKMKPSYHISRNNLNQSNK